MGRICNRIVLGLNTRTNTGTRQNIIVLQCYNYNGSQKRCNALFAFPQVSKIIVQNVS